MTLIIILINRRMLCRILLSPSHHRTANRIAKNRWVISRGALAAAREIGPADRAADLDPAVGQLRRVGEAFGIVGLVGVVGIALEEFLWGAGVYWFEGGLLGRVGEGLEVVEEEVEFVSFCGAGDDFCGGVVDFPLDGCLSGGRDTFFTDILSTKMERRRL